LHIADDELLINVANKLIVAPSKLADGLAQVVKALAEIKSLPLAKHVADGVASVQITDGARAIAKSLAEKEKTAVFLGNFAQHHPSYTTLHVLAQEIARLSGAKLGFLGEAANSVGAAVVNAEPGCDGFCAQGMKDKPRKAYLVLGAEPELDCHDGAATLAALNAAEMVVAFSPFKHAATGYADVLLPISPFSETAGTFVNTEGRVQSFNGVVKPLGETRPAWKVLRVLGNLLKVPGFDFNTVEDVRNDIAKDLGAFVAGKLNNGIAELPVKFATAAAGIERIGEVAIYAADPLVRRAPSLQKTADGKATIVASLSADLFDKLHLADGQAVRVKQGNGEAVLKARRDAKLPANCARIAGGVAETASLGALSGTISLEAVTLEQAAE